MSEFKYGIYVNRVAEYVDGHDGFDFLSRGDVNGFAVDELAVVTEIVFGLGGVDLPVVWFGVDEDGVGSSVDNAVGGSDKCEVTDKDLVAGLDSASDECSVEGGRSVDAGDCMVGLSDSGKFLFKLSHVASDAADPSGVKAIFDILPFVSAEVGNREGDKFLALVAF